ncbi:MAG: DUF192 domain-containing protein [Casimicrobiaceae bacterium]|nr:DUF192 domain-containing protein [Casimicrobiaceae bacterium]MCX8097844.1 DUF192 domain-containing protein [Casimicrobiaceae bacterium]MDW8311366.1 DUF192 domain-containing protein [Burkholderiales bacterium]
MRTAWLALCLGLLGVSVWSTASGLVNRGLPTVELSIAGKRLKAEVAADPQSRSIGLMNRFSLAPDHGMLFVFPEPQPLAFWMKNTYVPLSIAFIDAEGRILNIEDMKPHDETPVPSKGPALYALEMKQGWFRAHGIGPGQRVRGLDRVGRGR